MIWRVADHYARPGFFTAKVFPYRLLRFFTERVMTPAAFPSVVQLGPDATFRGEGRSTNRGWNTAQGFRGSSFHEETRPHAPQRLARDPRRSRR